MKKIIFLITIFFTSFSLHALESGKWTFQVEETYCYIASAPISEEGNYTKRGDVYVLVYRINKSADKIVQITSGYNYDENKAVVVKIDNTSFDFYANGDNAWTNDKDKEVIFAMQKGLKMVVKGYSSRGTLTTDTYTLNGFTAALKKLSKDC